MIYQTITRTIKNYGDAQGRVFELVHVTDEQDPWAHYTNKQTGQEYSCRLEAFLARFSAMPD